MLRILLLLLALPLAAQAQIALVPAAPRVHDMVEIKLDGLLIGDEWSGTPEVTMAANKITVTLPLTGASGIPVNLDWALGAFPAGNYQVEVTKRSSAGAVSSLAQSSFTVAPRTGNAPHTNFSDIYFNPSESGWGINVQQHPSDKLFATWFVYGLDNRPTWFVLPNGDWTGDRKYTGTLYRTRGPFFEDSPFDPAQVTVTPAGSATLEFTKYDTLVLTYSVDGVTVVKTAVRQAF